MAVLLMNCGESSVGSPGSDTASTTPPDTATATDADIALDSGTETEDRVEDDIGAVEPSPVQFPAEAVDLDSDPAVMHVELEAAPLAEPTSSGFLYGYNGQVPGPTIRLRVGDRLRVDLTNALGTPTTIHWHGMHVPYAMDGSLWRRDPIAAGETFRYEFIADRPGTFWYHPHFDTEQQVDLGLYGVIVVEALAEPAVDRDVVLVFDTPAERRDPQTPPGHAVSVRPTWLINGYPADVMEVAAGERIRARVLNASNMAYLAIDRAGRLEIAGDQGLHSAGVSDGVLLLAPGDRAEFEWRPGREMSEVSTLPYSLYGPAPGLASALLSFESTGELGPASPLAWPFDAVAPSADPTFTDVVYVFSGSDDAGGWFINGEVFPDITPTTVQLGTSVVIEVRNLSHSEHPFHLHGMAFELLSVDGIASPHRRVEDTVNVAIGQRVRILVEADNPGAWMAHCHILSHADDGMMTIFEVEDP
ncbi:MAG: FtsP/CotA-like multicopper oxidase with cupredoxin domain [Myxococcota bacterium]|jgi:FtsP/CotA-like multicopper oxidase with cupredoxin domain